VILTGLGTDRHKLVKNRPLIIGGVHIPFHLGEEAHSDGDVLIHALIDALLGAMALNDIGTLFPPEDNKWKNADSRMLLRNIFTLIRERGFNIVNIDSVIHLEKPRMGPFRSEIISNLASDLNMQPNRISVKAKTAEGLGPVGESLAIDAFCTILLERQ